MGEGHGEVPQEEVEDSKQSTPERKMMVGSSGLVTEVESLEDQMKKAEEDHENRDK